MVNNVQEMNLDTDHSLYANPDRTIQPQSIDLIYDTGAAISMMPAQYHYAWRNLRDCLHSLAGCFTRQTESHLQIGEFHGIITLDSGEARRVIIPECIQIQPGLSNTYLLADTAFLMAGHTYVSHLSSPKLKLSGGGTYTMSVTKEQPESESSSDDSSDTSSDSDELQTLSDDSDDETTSNIQKINLLFSGL